MVTEVLKVVVVIHLLVFNFWLKITSEQNKKAKPQMNYRRVGEEGLCTEPGKEEHEFI